MALGFIRKVFSFGKRDAEPKPETPTPALVEAPPPVVLAPETPAVEATSRVEAALRPASSPVPPEPEPEPAPESEPAPAEAPVSTSIEPANELAADAARATPAAGGEAPLAPPAAEIAAPIRQPSPLDPDPLIAELAPELAPVPAAVPAAPPSSPPSPPAPVATRVTVARTVEAKAAPAEPVAAAEPRQSWLQRLRGGLARSSRELTGNIAGVFTKRKLDEDTLQDLEDVLLRADLGMETAIRITGALASGRHGRNVSDEEVRAIMAQEIEKVLTPVACALELDLSHKPHVVLVVGVNGTGKTTTIGKLAAKLSAGGLKVTLAAGDTFRAAAIEQLKIWGERTGSPVVASKLGADAAGLAYDAFEKARAAGSDVLIIDTAGRLQNKTELMAELEKIVRVLGKLDPDAPHTVLQTVDATTGQNALNQVEIFRNVAGVNGLVMTKLDGTARGGILVAIAAKHRLPVYFIGVGEQVDDLEPFSARDFARAIAGVA